MKRLLSILLFSFAAFASQAQDRFPFQWNGKTFIDSLKASGIKDIISVKQYAPGSEIIFNEPQPACNTGGTYYKLYIVWKDNAQTKAKAFNNCFSYGTVSLAHDSIFLYSALYMPQLKTEQSSIRNKKEKGKAPFIVTAHSDITDVAVINAKSQLRFSFDEEEIQDNPLVYKNFNQSKLYQLKRLSEDLISNYYAALKE